MGNPHYSPQQKREFRDAFLRHCRNENRKRAYQLTGLEFNVSGDTIEKVIKQFTSGVIDADGVKRVHRGEPMTQIPTAGEPALSLPPARPVIRDEYNNDITFDAPRRPRPSTPSTPARSRSSRPTATFHTRTRRHTPSLSRSSPICSPTS